LALEVLPGASPPAGARVTEVVIDAQGLTIGLVPLGP
jgi:hypothetical protein